MLQALLYVKWFKFAEIRFTRNKIDELLYTDKYNSAMHDNIDILPVKDKFDVYHKTHTKFSNVTFTMK